MADQKKGSDKEKDFAFSEVVKKVVSIGVGAAFMTEDAVRSVLNDLPIPKDIVTGLIQNAKSAKADFAEGIQEELRSYLKKVDAKRLVRDIVDHYDIEVNATFKFKKKDDSPSVDE